MQWLVAVALRRPYTFIVLGLLIAFLGVFTCVITPKDVLPPINIPVVNIIWSYTGMSPDDMEKRMVTISERAMTTTVNDIEHIESQSLSGVSVIKVFFHPNAKIEAGVAQVTSIMQTLLRILPPGTTPPLIIQYSASSVPILQMGLDSDSLTEQQLYDYGTQFIRTQLATVQGASIPLPYGGKSRQVMVDLDLPALLAKGLCPLDVSTAISNQNLILPAGTAKMGATEYQVTLNSSPRNVNDINDYPIKVVNGGEIYLRDVARIHDGYAVQTNIVTINGRRAALLTALKSGNASTLDIVSRLRKRLPSVLATVPKSLRVKLLFDQSVFVRASVYGVIREGIVAAVLTALMILLFLGSWRSTLVVCTTIPLAILSSICLLSATGHMLNVMTLGGLALAVGILVDDATVEIENIHRNIGMEKGLRRAILDGAAQIANPTLVSTLSICIVFVSVLFLTGPAKFLFTPMALAVVFAMLASYMLSRTVIPVMVRKLLKPEIEIYRAEHAHRALQADPGWLWRTHHRFNVWFERQRDRYGEVLVAALRRRRRVGVLFTGFFILSALLLPFIGEDFFPTVDAGQFRLHVRTAPGMRIEETEHRFHEVEDALRRIIPPDEFDIALDNIGIPVGGVNLAFTDSAVIGPNDGEILVSLKPDHHPTADYMRVIRDRLPKEFPDTTFFFQPGDIVNQILNFGIPASIDIQVVGKDRDSNYAIAEQIEHQVALVKGAVDVHIHQVLNSPALNIVVDREKAAALGMQQINVANNVLVSLSSSGQTSPNYWLDPTNGVNYLVAVQTPQYHMDNIDELMKTPINLNNPADSLLSDVATIHHGVMQINISHYNVQPTIDVYANVQDRDLGGVSADVDRIVGHYRAQLPRGSQIMVRGQVQSMRESFHGLGSGIIFAIVLVYLLMAVNFQSWIDPLIIIMALPGALSGIVWMLFLTQTTFSVPSLMGTIMCVGVAVANSILLVTFANERREEGDDAFEAAHQAGLIRLRPVLMTALAMIIGMVPMSLALGEGGEQNAPLGRAVIGGLILATVTTLFLVPLVYSVLRNRPVEQLDPPDETESESQ